MLIDVVSFMNMYSEPLELNTLTTFSVSKKSLSYLREMVRRIMKKKKNEDVTHCQY